MVVLYQAEAKAASMRETRRFYAQSRLLVLPIKGRVPFAAALIGPGEPRAQVHPAPDLIGCCLFYQGAGSKCFRNGPDWPVRLEG